MSKTISSIIYIAIIIALGCIGLSYYSYSHAHRTPLSIDALNQKVVVTVYSTKTCPYCYKAKDLLTEYNIDYFEKDLSNPQYRSEFSNILPSVRSVPQIFIENEHIGGYSELKDLADTGQLLQKVAK